MIKKLSAGLCCAAIATLAVAGCSSQQDEADAYAKKLCDQVKPQLESIQQATDSIASVSTASNTPAQVQQADAAAFGRMADAHRALASAVQQSGAAPVSDGSALQKNVVRQLSNIAASYVQLQRTVQSLDTADQGKFAQGLKTVTEQLSALSGSSGDALNQLQEGDIGKAIAAQAACQKPASGKSGH